jgi:hypothetical protein
MNLYQECPECVRLWNAYAEATRDHIRIEGRVHLSQLSRDTGAVAALSPFLLKAAEFRTECRASILRHQNEVHGKADAASIESD